MQAIDPVCHMTVSSETALHREYQNRTYYFCCEGCAGAFDLDPGRYAGGGGTPGTGPARDIPGSGHHHHHGGGGGHCC